MSNNKEGAIILTLGGRPGMHPAAMPGLKYQKRRTVVIFAGAKQPYGNGSPYNQKLGFSSSPRIPPLKKMINASSPIPKVYDRSMVHRIPHGANGGYLGGKTFQQKAQPEKCSRNHGSRLSCIKCAHSGNSKVLI